VRVAESEPERGTTNRFKITESRSESRVLLIYLIFKRPNLSRGSWTFGGIAERPGTVICSKFLPSISGTLIEIAAEQGRG